MGAAQVRKGKTWEREVAKRLREAMPGCDSKRGFQARGGEEDADVRHPLFQVECKSHKLCNVRAALRQAEKDVQLAKWPVAICKDSPRKGKEESYVTMRLDDWLEVMAAYWTETEGKKRGKDER